MGDPKYSRRTLLAAIGVVIATATGVATYVSSPSTATERQIATADRVQATGAAKPTIRFERVYSAARHREVTLAFYVPTGPNPRGLPMSILLHGLHGDARHAAVGNLAEVLTAAVAKGSVPAFGFVAVDGGDNYWHENVPGDDPMTMLLDEVPRWLKERGYGEPFAVTGVSMGGFGSLLYARRRAERGDPIAAAAAISPGLITTWPEMAKRKAFKNEGEWASLDPLRHPKSTGPTALGVWIGDRDRFIEGTRRYMREVRPEVGVVKGGGHDDGLYRKVTPDVVQFLAKYAKKAV
ncbi:alpha/beta hydrolase-fold protein [Lentzea sp. BCCO 10_0856]|uniref:Acyl-CoA:diacylglycerol acyltransferase n=1 Tax=Lentzea miocenica TaxID=3095431 RepID=A0ABU4T4G5_9PSEU|nr:alpha/beta hydrolase-fold protein [Lentzea sp. BCCO 10_0856]MDX8033051.1 alpha/beta hydrolase-fold protein [Lentzea sp. BCCO 10_0856]